MFKKKLGRFFQIRKNLEVEIGFKKIWAHDLAEELDFVDLSVVWKRGGQENETKGYELNYIEVDMEMDEVFRRVSKFYSKSKNFSAIEDKICVFQLKEYKQLKDKRIDTGTVLAQYHYNMSKHVGDICAGEDYGDENDLFKDVESKRLPLVRIKFAPITDYGTIMIDFTIKISQTYNTVSKELIKEFNTKHESIRSSYLFNAT
jgi:hypothetical protein